MNKKEFSILIKLIRTTYPQQNLFPNEESIEIWYRMLKDIPYEIAMVAVEKWISMNKWAPAISDIREYATGMCQEQEQDWGEGWNELLRAIARYGYYDEDGALESMSPVTRETVRRLGFKELCLSTNQMADRANFRTVYETISKRNKEDAQLPGRLLDQIQQMKLQSKGVNLLDG
ncbi:MAG: replicative helicase loader/inhibitor [Bacteroidaceae bacterium]|nr:replicative helicase loader/inhibitor [Bacteroidaceae bacterium]